MVGSGEQIMRESLKFERVDTQEKLDNWKTFADSFVHGSDRPMMPIVTVSRGAKMFGYWNTLNYPVLFPSFHPKHTSPRDFKEMVDAFTHVQHIASMGGQYPNGVAFCGLATNGLAVGRNIVTKCGYDNLGIEIYRRLG